MKQWKRKLREEKEKVERERRERLEWRVMELRRRGPSEDSGRRTPLYETRSGQMTRMRTQSRFWKGRQDNY